MNYLCLINRFGSRRLQGRNGFHLRDRQDNHPIDLGIHRICWFSLPFRMVFAVQIKKKPYISAFLCNAHKYSQTSVSVSQKILLTAIHKLRLIS